MIERCTRLVLAALLVTTPAVAQSIPERVKKNGQDIEELRKSVDALEKKASASKGPQGPQGKRGERGERGFTGPPGQTGPKGDAGEPGESAEFEQVTFGAGHVWFMTPEEQRIAYMGISQAGGGIAQFFNSAGEDVAYIGIDAEQKGRLEILGNGSVVVNGDKVHDYAEVFEFATREGVRPGTVMAVAGDGPALGPSQEPYDPRVVGVVSGAGPFVPGMRIGTRSDGSADLPLAVAGQVYVRVCLEGGPIRPGDLLVASSRPGVAMRASDRLRALGAVVGKALTTYDKPGDGEALVRMLVMTR